MLCIVLIINQRESSSQAQTNWKTVTLEGLLEFLSDCAAIPPVVEHSEACQFSPLPRSDPPWAPWWVLVAIVSLVVTVSDSDVSLWIVGDWTVKTITFSQSKLHKVSTCSFESRLSLSIYLCLFVCLFFVGDPRVLANLDWQGRGSVSRGNWSSCFSSDLSWTSWRSHWGSSRTWWTRYSWWSRHKHTEGSVTVTGPVRGPVYDDNLLYYSMRYRSTLDDLRIDPSGAF